MDSSKPPISTSKRVIFFKGVLNSKGISFVFPLLLALLPIIVVFFEEKPIPYVIIALLLLFFLRKDKSIDLNNVKLLIKPYLLIICIYLIYTFASVDVLAGAKILERQISLLLIPLLVFSYNFNEFSFKIFFETFIYAMLLASMISFTILICFVFNHSEWIETMNQTNNSNTYLQFKFPHIIGVHPTYWSYLLIMANIFLMCSNGIKLQIKKGFVITLLIIFNFNILYLSARTPILINLLIHFISLIVYFKNRKASVIKLTGAIVLLIVFNLLAFNLPLNNAKINIIVDDDRVFLWPEVIKQIKANYFVLGEGLGQGKEVLRNFIIENGDPRVYYRGLDIHNQYLMHYLDMGILGLTALMYLVISPILKIKGKINFNNLPLVGFSLMFIFSLLTESSLYLIKGIIIFAVFSSILVRHNHLRFDTNK